MDAALKSGVHYNFFSSFCLIYFISLRFSLMISQNEQKKMYNWHCCKTAVQKIGIKILRMPLIRLKGAAKRGAQIILLQETVQHYLFLPVS